MRPAGSDQGFAHAARALLARPLLGRDDAAWPDVARNAAKLTSYFEDSCGWALQVDRRAGTARLHKRRRTPDPTRGALRHTGNRMRSDGYAALMLTMAELATRPTTTVGDLADNLAAAALADSTLPAFDATIHAHRLRFVDALRWLEGAGIITVTAGDLSRYQGGEGDAVVVADTSRIAQVLSTGTPPSRVGLDLEASTDDWIAALSEEPRYRQAVEGIADTDATNRWARHTICRALLDDPVVDTTGLDPALATYLATGPGRQWLRQRVATAGLSLEENVDCLVAVDETGEATDAMFGRTPDHPTQVAVAVLDEFCRDREPTAVRLELVVAFVADLLRTAPKWAAKFPRDGAALTGSAVDVLVAFGLATADSTTLRLTPAAGRFVTTVIDSRDAGGQEDL